MNVDIDNFSEVRQFILTEKLIEKSEVISFDLQFAGLKFEGNDRDRSEYLPAQKYQRMSAVARKYCIMQVGITFFVPEQKSQVVIPYPFNFYIFPRPTIYGDPIVSLQSGCVSFNITNKMDWSRWIQKGITYMKLTQYERINDIQQKARKFEELFEFLEGQIKMTVKEIIKEIQQREKNKVDDKMSKEGEGKNFELPSSSFVFTKKVIEKYFEENEKLYVIKTSDQSVSDHKFKEQETIQFQIVKITKVEKERIQNKKSEELYGFTLLFQKIWNSGKTFIGHNFFFDLLFMYDAFIASLPYDYQLFKKFIMGIDKIQGQDDKLIPESEQKLNKRIFYDTKYISNNLNFKLQFLDQNTSLQGIYKAINQKNLARKIIILPKQYERYELKNQVLHEAGFDSYLTGWLYYQMIELSKSNKLDAKEQYQGRINLNRSYFYIDLDNFEDGVCEHEKVFYIQVVEPKKYLAIDYIKKQRSDVFKNLRQILKDENIVKDVLIREGLKQVFIEIKQQKNYKRITSILIKYMKQKKIKDLYTLSHFLAAKNAKQWADAFSKNINNGPAN